VFCTSCKPEIIQIKIEKNSRLRFVQNTHKKINHQAWAEVKKYGCYGIILAVTITLGLTSKTY
jgi:hypothetical protein